MVEHSKINDLEIRLKIGSLTSPDCECTIFNRNARLTVPALEQMAELGGTACEALLPPSPERPWYLEVTDMSTGETGTINRFEVHMGEAWGCFDPDVPIAIPDDGTPVASMVNCTAFRGLAPPTPFATPTPTATGTPSTPTPAPDTDGDGCTDPEEAACAESPKPGFFGPHDRLNPYDFYDVPVPTAFDGGTLDDRDKAVNLVGDVLAVLEYSGTSDGGPCNGGPDGIPGNADDRCYNQDKNGDGEDDGLLYDRSNGIVWSNGPNGGINTIEDLLLVLAQTGQSCQGPP